MECKALNLRQRIKKTKWGHYLWIVFRYRYEASFRRWVDNHENPDAMLFENLGDENSGKTIYYIYGDREGFFAMWLLTVTGIDYAQRHGFVPVVDWTRNNSYYQCEMSHLTENPFEYFFLPVSDIGVEEAKQSRSVVFKRKKCDRIGDDEYQPRNFYLSEKPERHYIEINRNKIHLKSEIENQIIGEIEQLLSEPEKTVAVHVRGVDFGGFMHPIPIPWDYYLRRIYAVMEKCGFEKVFLATDSDGAINYFKKRLGAKLLFYDGTARSKAGSKKLMIFDKSIKRENHNYLMGYEVLRDMLTMTVCDGLIAGPSNVRYAALVFKETWRFARSTGGNGSSEGEKWRHLELLETRLAE